MHKSEIFKKAHEITKKVIQSGDSYQVTFSAALREIYSDLKKESIMSASMTAREITAREISVEKVLKLLESKNFTVEEIDTKEWATYIECKHGTHYGADYAEIEIDLKGRVVVHFSRGEIKALLLSINQE